MRIIFGDAQALQVLRGSHSGLQVNAVPGVVSTCSIKPQVSPKELMKKQWQINSPYIPINNFWKTEVKHIMWYFC